MFEKDYVITLIDIKGNTWKGNITHGFPSFLPPSVDNVKKKILKLYPKLVDGITITKIERVVR